MRDGQGTRIIRNRDILLMSRVFQIMQEVCRLEERIAWQKERAYNVTQRITGMPGGHGGAGGLDAALAALDELTEQYSEQVQGYMRELRAAEEILNGIQSPSMRTFVTLLYVDNMPQAAVRRELNMTEYAFTRAREAVEQAESMADVEWREAYALRESGEKTAKTLDSRGGL